jgi:O-antigen/teichoic acid export membrane protein
MDKKKVITSLVYKFIERLSVKGLGLVIGIILARMLAPDQFGLIAIMNVFINLSQVIVEGGFTTALIQRKDVTEQDYSTVFYINIALAAVCFAALEIGAPWISIFYKEDITLPLRIYAVCVFFGAFNALQLARLQKRMQFRKIMICSLIATVLSGVVGIVGAYCNLGLWALILYHLMNSVTVCFTVAFAERWLPKLEFSLNRAKVLFSYGWKMFISAVLCSLYADIRSLVIGKKFSSDDLAYYDRGQKFPQIISHTLDSSIQSVMFPTMASVQDDKNKLAKMLRSAETMGAYVVIPVMFGLAAVSEVFIDLHQDLRCFFKSSILCTVVIRPCCAVIILKNISVIASCITAKVYAFSFSTVQQCNSGQSFYHSEHCFDIRRPTSTFLSCNNI